MTALMTRQNNENASSLAFWLSDDGAVTINEHGTRGQLVTTVMALTALLMGVLWLGDHLEREIAGRRRCGPLGTMFALSTQPFALSEWRAWSPVGSRARTNQFACCFNCLACQLRQSILINGNLKEGPYTGRCSRQDLQSGKRALLADAANALQPMPPPRVSFFSWLSPA